MILIIIMWQIIGALLVFLSGVTAGNAMHADEFSRSQLVAVALALLAFGCAALGFATFTAVPL